MKVLTCPVNGPRNLSEFACIGEVREPVPEDLDDAAFALASQLFGNRAGWVREWWRHTPTNTWFIAERHTVTNEIRATYLPPGRAGA